MKIQDKFDLTGRVAAVTGGVGLLGAEFCRTLAEAGAAVAVVDLNEPASQAVAATPPPRKSNCIVSIRLLIDFATASCC